jgi:hypothetical protein
MDLVLWRTDEFSLSEKNVRALSIQYGKYTAIDYILEWIAPRYPVVAPEIDRLRAKMRVGCKPIVDEYDRLISLQSPDVVAQCTKEKNKAYHEIRGMLSESRPPDRRRIETLLLPRVEQEIDKMIEQAKKLEEIKG